MHFEGCINVSLNKSGASQNMYVEGSTITSQLCEAWYYIAVDKSDLQKLVTMELYYGAV